MDASRCAAEHSGMNTSNPSAPTTGAVLPTEKPPYKLLRLPAVEERTALRKSSIYAQVKAGKFPAPVRLTENAVAWRESEINAWIESRVKV